MGWLGLAGRGGRRRSAGRGRVNTRPQSREAIAGMAERARMARAYTQRSVRPSTVLVAPGCAGLRSIARVPTADAVGHHCAAAARLRRRFLVPAASCGCSARGRAAFGAGGGGGGEAAAVVGAAWAEGA